MQTGQEVRGPFDFDIAGKVKQAILDGTLTPENMAAAVRQLLAEADPAAVGAAVGAAAAAALKDLLASADPAALGASLARVARAAAGITPLPLRAAALPTPEDLLDPPAGPAGPGGPPEGVTYHAHMRRMAARHLARDKGCTAEAAAAAVGQVTDAQVEACGRRYGVGPETAASFVGGIVDWFKSLNWLQILQAVAAIAAIAVFLLPLLAEEDDETEPRGAA